ncbi:MAG TPA: AraC family transcriptional regulator [Rariglobus sp.]
MESFHGLPAGGLTRSAQIHRSWGMAQHRLENIKRRLKVYSLVYLLEGEGVFSDERGKTDVPIRAGDLLCLFPHVGHVYTPSPGTRWNEINIEFFGPAFDAWMGTGLLDPAEPVRHLTPVGHWLKCFHEIVLPLAKPGREPTLRDTGRLIALIADMCSMWAQPQSDQEIAWAARARAELLALPPEKPLDLNKAAKTFGLGEQAYRKKFKRLCGVTPTTFRSRHLIEQACHELMGSGRAIKEIAFSLGFTTEFYFFRRFKQITGLSPGEYRRRATQ